MDWQLSKEYKELNDNDQQDSDMDTRSHMMIDGVTDSHTHSVSPESWTWTPAARHGETETVGVNRQSPNITRSMAGASGSGSGSGLCGSTPGTTISSTSESSHDQSRTPSEYDSRPMTLSQVIDDLQLDHDHVPEDHIALGNDGFEVNPDGEVFVDEAFFNDIDTGAQYNDKIKDLQDHEDEMVDESETM